MKFEEKVQAVKLRKNGQSYSEISRKLKVSKSTLSGWLKDIESSSQQKKKLMTKRQLAGYKGAKMNQNYADKRRKMIIEKAKKEAEELINNPLFLAGLMLYWAEGNKRGGEKVVISNSDPEIIRLMMRWFREICHVPEYKFRVSLYIHRLHIRKDVRDFWFRITGVPLSQFGKDTIKPTIHSQRTNKLYEGVCRITIHSTDLFRKIIGWKIGAIDYFEQNKNLSIKEDPTFIDGIIFRQMSKWSQSLSD